ncbi:hypothetical protein GCM10009789_28480 [Kribbella sancticallisti]|uniref:Uncharacterized protein n=1 Tax=Kribbella sancticallisti TaxID=460087 RepID=A0ABP4P432_9ACTN
MSRAAKVTPRGCTAGACRTCASERKANANPRAGAFVSHRTAPARLVVSRFMVGAGDSRDLG